MGLVVQSGRLLSRLTEEGWRSEAPPPAAGKALEVPAELRAAQKQLEELPALGLFGNANANQLLPRGFRS